jgi:hypothetical protein
MTISASSTVAGPMGFSVGTTNLRGGLANHNETIICDADLALEEIEELEGVSRIRSRCLIGSDDLYRAESGNLYQV